MVSQNFSTRASRPFSRRHPARRAFTLIELMVVIGIMGVLVAITLIVGAKIVAGGKANLTRDSIRVLDSTLGTLTGQQGGNPSAFMYDPEKQAQFERGEDFTDQDDVPLIPIADARWQTREIMINSGGLFLAQARAEGIDLATGLDQDLIQTYSPDQGSAASAEAFPTLPTVMDSWGQPVRYVHPKFDGQIVNPDPRVTDTQGGYVDIADENQGYVFGRGGATWLGDNVDEMLIRRNAIQEGEDMVELDQRDGDGGVCSGNLPYFYSAGPDGDPSTIEDNVYTAVPNYVELP